MPISQKRISEAFSNLLDEVSKRLAFPDTVARGAGGESLGLSNRKDCPSSWLQEIPQAELGEETFSSNKQLLGASLRRVLILTSPTCEAHPPRELWGGPAPSYQCHARTNPHWKLRRGNPGPPSSWALGLEPELGAHILHFSVFTPSPGGPLLIYSSPIVRIIHAWCRKLRHQREIQRKRTLPELTTINNLLWAFPIFFLYMFTKKMHRVLYEFVAFFT